MNDPKMTDVISRSDLLRNLGKRIHAERKRLLKDAFLDFSSAIINAPALDVAPVVPAMWMLDSSFYSARIYHCTACNTKQMQTSKFCPECGAKMDGEENG